MRKRILLCLASLSAAVFSACSQEAPVLIGGPEQWRFAIEETAGSVQDAYAQRFKQLIEEKSGGEIEVSIYPYGTLGTSDQVTELLGMGTVQFAMASPGHLGTLMPEVQVFLLHFVLSDDPVANEAALNDPDLRKELNVIYGEKGLRLLSVYSEGWMVWTTQKEIRRPVDFAGVKMRVMTSPLLLAAYEAYGASPTPLPYGEVYSGLQLHMIDGQVNPVFAIQEMSFYEVTDWMISPRHAPFITTAVTNEGFYQSLPPARKKLVDETIAELRPYIFEEQQRYNRERMDLILERKPGLQVVDNLSAEERAEFRDASMGVRDQFVRMAGPRGEKVLNLLLRAVKRAKAGDGQ
ncbi:MAG: C4-dicarboxylate ABC transporter [Candidatus Hydrogenedens sp.]|nr:C4-dicarboxylate ABC transporter [Candidatus Hydrogenedens sp.]